MSNCAQNIEQGLRGCNQGQAHPNSATLVRVWGVALRAGDIGTRWSSIRVILGYARIMEKKMETTITGHMSHSLDS